MVHADLLEHLLQERLGQHKQQQTNTQRSVSTYNFPTHTTDKDHAYLGLAAVVVQFLEWPVVALLKVVEHQVLELVLDNSTIQRVVKDDTAFLQPNHKRDMSLFLSNTYLAHLDLLVDLVAELQVTRLLHSTIVFPQHSSISSFHDALLYNIHTRDTYIFAVGIGLLDRKLDARLLHAGQVLQRLDDSTMIHHTAIQSVSQDHTLSEKEPKPPEAKTTIRHLVLTIDLIRRCLHILLYSSLRCAMIVQLFFTVPSIAMRPEPSWENTLSFSGVSLISTRYSVGMPSSTVLWFTVSSPYHDQHTQSHSVSHIAMDSCFHQCGFC